MKVSILLPVYNAEATLQETISSIINQTFTDFELIIINDGSDDNSENIILQNTDKRIRYYKNINNKGLIFTLNRGLSLCKGEYIARIDADDIAISNRLEIQVNFLDQNPLIDMVGSARIMFGNGVHKRIQRFPLKDSDIRAYFYIACPIVHPSIMLRNSTIKKYNLQYDVNFPHMEDYKLWYDILKVGKVENLNTPLIYYRVSQKQISTKYQKEQQSKNKTFRKSIISDFLNKKNICFNQINQDLVLNIINLKCDNITEEKIKAAILFIILISFQTTLRQLFTILFIKRIWKISYFNFKYFGAIILHHFHLKSFSYLAI